MVLITGRGSKDANIKGERNPLTFPRVGNILGALVVTLSLGCSGQSGGVVAA